MAQLSIAQAAAALGVSVDTIRRRIKSGLLRATRTDRGAYLVEVPGVDDNAPAVSAQAPATDFHLFAEERRREPHSSTGELSAVKELLEAERRHNEELKEQMSFLRQQLEQAESARERLVQLLDTLSQQLGIEQMQRLLGDRPEPPSRQ
jgi:excisionase family DNA binding protein